MECSECHEDTTVFMKCMECTNTYICPPCFARGVEFKSHVKSHSYKIIDNGSFFVIDQNWSAVEEKLLLEGIEQFGIGNWEDAAGCIEGRTAQDLEEHYYGSYIESIDFGRVTVPQEIPNRVTDHTPPLHESVFSAQLQPIDVTKEQESQLAYMPLRDDYEMEHDNEAESVISGLTTNTDDSDLDTNLKVAQVSIYLDKLRERHRRKCVAREHHLVEKFYHKHNKEYPKRLLPCLQYMKEEQAMNFSKIYKREQILKAKIKHLKLYRKNGISKLEDGIVFDVKQQRRTRAKMSSKPPEQTQNEKPIDKILLEYGNHLLSNEEKRLCKALRMIPSRYLTSKVLIIKEFIQKQHGLGIKVRFPSYLEKSQRRKITNFLVSNGWLPRVQS